MKTSKMLLAALVIGLVGLVGCREGEELVKLREEVKRLTDELEDIRKQLEVARGELSGCNAARQFEILQMPTDPGTTIGYAGADDLLHVSAQHGQYMLGNKAFRDKTAELARHGLWEAHPSVPPPTEGDWVFRVFDTAQNMTGAVYEHVLDATCATGVLTLTIKGAADPTTLDVGELRCASIRDEIVAFTGDAAIKAILDKTVPEANLVVAPVDKQPVVRVGVRFNKWGVNGKFHGCPSTKTNYCPVTCQTP